jgi:hypothetical protein
MRLARSCVRHLLAAPTDGKPITKFADLSDAFFEVTKALRAALAVRRRTAGRRQSRTSLERTVGASPAPVGPRSSNLRLKKSFTEAERDRFLDEAFEFMARFFGDSLAELEKRHPGIETSFKRIDAHQFTAVAYREGKVQVRCRIFRGGFSGGIAYSANDRGFGDSYNESISVEADEQSLFLRPLGMANAHERRPGGSLDDGCGARASMETAQPARDPKDAPRGTAAEDKSLRLAARIIRVHWVRPELVVAVRYLAWTEQGLLRQVIYQGLREDKPAREIRR